MSGQIISFPAAQRRVQIQQAARMLNETHGEAAATAYKILVRKMADEMTAMGISQGEMRRQVLEFQAAVQIELMAQSNAEQSQPA